MATLTTELTALIEDWALRAARAYDDMDAAAGNEINACIADIRQTLANAAANQQSAAVAA